MFMNYWQFLNAAVCGVVCENLVDVYVPKFCKTAKNNEKSWKIIFWPKLDEFYLNIFNQKSMEMFLFTLFSNLALHQDTCIFSYSQHLVLNFSEDKCKKKNNKIFLGVYAWFHIFIVQCIVNKV